MPEEVADSGPHASVRCPWCGDTYGVSRVLEALPPALVVVDEGQAAAATGRVDEVDESSEMFAGIGEAQADQEDAPFEMFDAGDAAAADSAAAPRSEVPTAGLRTSPARRKKKTSPVLMLVQWVGGGVAGIAIALLILWYFDRLPAIGPLKQWANRETASRTDGRRLTPAGGGAAADAGPDAEDEGGEGSEFALPDFSRENPLDFDPTGKVDSDVDESGGERGAADATPEADEPADGEELGIPEDSGDPADPFPADDPEDPEASAVEGGAMEDVVETEAAGADDPLALDLAMDDELSAAAIESPELTIAIEGADQAVARLLEYEDGERAELVERTLAAYRHLAALGEALAAAPSVEPTRLDAILARLEERDEFLSAFRKYAASWLARGADRENSGMVAIGEVARAEPVAGDGDPEEAGEWQLEWSGAAPLRLAGERARSLDGLEGQRVMVLGHIASETTPTVTVGAVRALAE